MTDRWLETHEAPEYDTPSGFLEAGYYALGGFGRGLQIYLLPVPDALRREGQGGPHISTANPQAIAGLTLATPTGRQKYRSVFVDGSTVTYQEETKEKHDRLRTTQGEPQPTRRVVAGGR